MKTEFRYGKKIKEHREERAWTQEHLAEVAGVDTRTIQRVERDLTKGLETLQAIASAFDVDLRTLRSTWRIAESRLTSARFASTYADFISAEEQDSSQAFCRCIMAPLKSEFRGQIQELFDQAFEDRDLINPYEHDLWRCHTECIREPLERLFDLDFAFYLLDERRDLFLRPALGIKPDRNYVEDWCIRYFALVPRHGCFQLSRTERLHRFDSSCEEGRRAFFRTQKPNVGTFVYTNALFALRKEDGERSVNWCDTCFPRLPDGARISLEYMGRVTGLSTSQLYDLADAASEEPFLQGLS